MIFQTFSAYLNSSVNQAQATCGNANGGGGTHCLMVWSLEKHPLQDKLKCEAEATNNDKNNAVEDI